MDPDQVALGPGAAGIALALAEPGAVLAALALRQ